MGSRDATVQIRASKKKLRGDLAGSKKLFMGTFRDIGRGAKNAVGALGVFGAMNGGFALGKEVLDFENTLTRVAIQAGDVGKLDSLRASAKGIGKEFGLSQLAVAKGQKSLVDLQGVAGVSTAKLRILAQTSLATGVEMEDLTGTIFALQNAFGLADAKDLEGALSGAIAVGKAGSVPLEEMNLLLQQMAKEFARFSGTGRKSAVELAATFQLLREGFGSGAEAKTGLKAFLVAVDKNDKKFRRFGITVSKTGKDGVRRMLPMTKILDQMIKKNIVNRKGFAKLIGSAEGRQAARILVEQRKKLDELTDSGLKSNAVQKDAAAFLASNAGKQQKALAAAKQALVDLATPERIEKFTDALGKMADIIAFAADNVEVLLAATVAWKAAGLAAGAFKAARAFTLLGDNAGAAQKALSGFRGETTAGTLGRFAAGAAALAGGFALGAGAQKLAKETGVSGGIAEAFGLGGLKRRAIRQKQEKQEQRNIESQSVSTLVEADAISSEGVVNQALVRSLRKAQAQGQELSPLQQAAETALGGKTGLATTDLGTFSQFADPSRFAPETSEMTAELARLNENLAKSIAETQRQNEINEKLAEKDVVLKVDGREIARAGKNSDVGKRSPR